MNGRWSTSCPRHGRRLAWCSIGEHSTREYGGSADDRRLAASVVLRTNTTVLPGGQSMNLAAESRACSYASVETSLRRPPPRWTLPYHGRNALTASTAAWSAGVVAA